VTTLTARISSQSEVVGGELAADEGKQRAALGNRTQTYALRASPVIDGCRWLSGFDHCSRAGWDRVLLDDVG
jgi:hypothetical protein